MMRLMGDGLDTVGLLGTADICSSMRGFAERRLKPGVTPKSLPLPTPPEAAEAARGGLFLPMSSLASVRAQEDLRAKSEPFFIV